MIFHWWICGAQSITNRLEEGSSDKVGFIFMYSCWIWERAPRWGHINGDFSRLFEREHFFSSLLVQGSSFVLLMERACKKKKKKKNGNCRLLVVDYHQLIVRLRQLKHYESCLSFFFCFVLFVGFFFCVACVTRDVTWFTHVITDMCTLVVLYGRSCYLIHSVDLVAQLLIDFHCLLNLQRLVQASLLTPTRLMGASYNNVIFCRYYKSGHLCGISNNIRITRSMCVAIVTKWAPATNAWIITVIIFSRVYYFKKGNKWRAESQVELPFI